MFLENYSESLELNNEILLEDPQFILDTFDEETSKLFDEDMHLDDTLFDEDFMFYDESYLLDDYPSLKKASDNIQKETLRLFNQIEKRWGSEDRKCRTYYYRIRRKCLTRLENIMLYRRRGLDASAVRYICNYDLVKMIGNIVEVPNLQGILRSFLKGIEAGVTGGVISGGYNLVVSRRVAATHEGQQLLNKYCGFLKELAQKCEAGMKKHSNGEDTGDGWDQ